MKLSDKSWHFLPNSVACILDQVAIKKSYQKGEFLFHTGDSPKGLFFIFNGLVGLFNISAEGKEHLLRIFGNGQCLGHRSLAAQESYHASAKILENSDIGFVDSDTTMKLLETHPEFAKTMLKKLAIELRRAEQRLASSSEKQVAERVAEAMLYLKETYPDHKWTRNEIAFYCGSTGPTVIRTLADFENKGFISQKGRDITIVDKNALREFANIEE